MNRFEAVKENTLRTIRNNERFEDFMEELVKYADENKNLELALMIGKCLDGIEKYIDIDEEDGNE